MEGFHIRQATLDDKQAVLDINDNVYNGFDYLKDLYDGEFINSPNTKSYVAVYDNKIVGFAGATVVDDGQTVISRAARINKEYSNKGFYKMLKNHASTNSGATIDAFTTGDTNPAINNSSFQQQNRHVFSVIFEMFQLSPNDARLRCDVTLSPIKPNGLTQSLLQEYFETDHYRNYLFPNDRLIVNLVPYRTISSNIPLLWTRSDLCQRITDVRKTDDGMRGLVSILTTFIAVNGVLCGVLDIFGNDMGSLKGHIMSHFDFLSKRNETGIGLCVLSQLEIGYENIENIFGEFGLNKIEMNTFDTPSYQKAICLYERKLRDSD